MPIPSTSLPYSWIRKIDPSLAQLDTIPLSGQESPFPWEPLAQQLQGIFALSSCSLVCKDVQWQTAEELFADLPEDLAPLHFSLSSLEGKAYWIMTKGELQILQSLLLMHSLEPVEFLEATPEQGFYPFLALEILRLLDQSTFFQGAVPFLEEDGTIPQESFLTLNIALQANEITLHGRLLISSKLQKSWKKHVAEKPLLI